MPAKVLIRYLLQPHGVFSQRDLSIFPLAVDHHQERLATPSATCTNHDGSNRLAAGNRQMHLQRDQCIMKILFLFITIIQSICNRQMKLSKSRKVNGVTSRRLGPSYGSARALAAGQKQAKGSSAVVGRENYLSCILLMQNCDWLE